MSRRASGNDRDDGDALEPQSFADTDGDSVRERSWSREDAPGATTSTSEERGKVEPFGSSSEERRTRVPGKMSGLTSPGKGVRGRALMTAYEAMLRESSMRSKQNAPSPVELEKQSSFEQQQTIKRKAKKERARRQKSERRKRKEQTTYKRSKFAISPQHAILQRWEGCMMLLLCYTAIVTPVEVGFYEPKVNAIFYVNQVVTASFIIDLILNFFTAIVHPRTGLLVYNLNYIAQRYLKKWFIIDFVSCIPFDAMYLGVGGVLPGFASLGALRTLRLLRLVKLMRAFRLSRLYKNLELKYSLDYSLIELVKFGITAVMFAHWLACGFGLVEDLERASYSWSRLTDFGGVVVGVDGGDPREIVGSFRLYLAALYWSTMTISTIGYGDIVPVTSGERVYVIIAMLIGAFEYGYIVGAVSNVIATRNEKTNKFQALMRDLNSFMGENRFPPSLCVRLREYFRYQLEGSDEEMYKRLLLKMSPALRGECSIRMNTWIKHVDFFKGCPEEFVTHLSTLVVEHAFPPEETLFSIGDNVTTLFVIRRGLVNVAGVIRTSGKTIAEEALFTTLPMVYSARAVTYADIYTLERDDFHAALEPFSATKRYFKLRGIKKVFRDEILAFSKAYYALKEKGIDADLSGEINDRPEFYLRKLRIIYGEDGEGLDDPKILEAKTKAAIVIQKRFRGMLHRVMMHGALVERDVHGIFHKMLRERDPVSYTARAIDVFHWRLAYSLTEVHRKLNSLLDYNEIEEEATEVKADASLMANALAAASGKVMLHTRSKQKTAGTPGERSPSPRISAGGWMTSGSESALQTLQSRVDELTNRLVPLDRRITNSQAKQTAALVETNERLNELAMQLEALVKLTVTSMESGIAEARVTARTRPRRALSPPPVSEASKW